MNLVDQKISLEIKIKFDFVYMALMDFNISLYLFFFYIFRPGSSRFREKWLKDIIESKVQLLEAMEF